MHRILILALSVAVFFPTCFAYRVKFDVSIPSGDASFIINVDPQWAPIGAARFKELVESKFFDGCRFFRVIPGFMAQIGINGDPATSAEWRSKTIPDEPVLKSNLRGYVSFAKTGMPNSRTTQFFVNYGDNSRLDGMGFAPFGIIEDSGERLLAHARIAPHDLLQEWTSWIRFTTLANGRSRERSRCVVEDSHVELFKCRVCSHCCAGERQRIPESKFPADFLHQNRGHYPVILAVDSRAVPRIPPRIRLLDAAAAGCVCFASWAVVVAMGLLSMMRAIAFENRRCSGFARVLEAVKFVRTNVLMIFVW